MADVIKDMLNQGWELHNAGRLDEAEKIYQALLCRSPADHQLLYLIADIAMKRGHNGMALNLLSIAISIRPDFRPAYINAGCCAKAEHYNDLAEEFWNKAMEIEPNAEVYNNLATLYADSGMPQEALEMADKAASMLPPEQEYQMPHIQWNRALALLSKGEWKDGWIAHEARKPLKTKSCSPRDYAPEWDGKTEVKRLIVHGEQGIGDEVMFLSCLPDLMGQLPNTDIVVECEPRLIPSINRSFGLAAYGTMVEVKEKSKPFDAQVAMGTLPMFYRNHGTDFPLYRAYLKPDVDLVEQAKEMLKDKPRPWIATAWVGGTKQTRVHHRSVSLKVLQPLIPGTIVPVQFGKMADVEAKEAGVEWFDDWSDGTNIDKQMALIYACDLLVSPCGTVIHLAGAMGVEAIVLTPLRSSWRYGMNSGKGAMAWYGQHTILRQEKEGDWDSVFKQLDAEMKSRYP